MTNFASLVSPEGATDGAPRYAPIRVLMIGGATLVRAGLRALISKANGIEIIGEGSTLAEARQHADSVAPDVMLLDMSNTPDLALGTLDELRQCIAAARTLVVAIRSDPEAIGRMVLAGAQGVVFNDAAADQLLTAIRKVHAGELWFDRATTAQIITGSVGTPRQEEAHPESARIASLTRRERELIMLVARGLSNKAIAARMKISDSTVRHYLTSIFGKLDVPDRLALLVYAVRHNLAAPKT